MFGTSVQADVWGIEIVNKSKLSTGGSQLVGVTGNEMAGNNLAGNDAIGNDAISDDEITVESTIAVSEDLLEEGDAPA